jgi:hypothetical protein
LTGFEVFDAKYSPDSSSESMLKKPTNPLDPFCVPRIIADDGIVRHPTACRKCETGARPIWIPRSVQILIASCFNSYALFPSISFQSNSGLKRIELSAFSYSSLQSIVIPGSVQFIDGSAFEDTTLNSISIEAGNDVFRVEHEFLIDIVHHRLIRNFSFSSDIEIPRTMEMLGSSCFSSCESHSFISFESKLTIA